MELKKSHWIGFGFGLLIVIISLFLMESKLFYLIIGAGVIIGVLPFVISTMQETKISAEKEEMFLEFARNLVESVKTGTPISRSIMISKGRSYGVLSENIEKLADQISLGIPLSIALQTFSKDVSNKTVSRAITLIGQAEKAGGDIGKILESVAGAVNMSDRLKKERKASISTLVVQGYIIFFVFIVIILVMQFKIIPMISNITDIGSVSNIVEVKGEGINTEEVSNAFLYLLLIQGFFSGLTIGKLSEGNIKTGVKHSFALMLSSFLISSLANLIWA